MMYNSTAIQALVDRIGWAVAVPPTNITLDTRNVRSDSGRYFNAFHKLAIVENIEAAKPNADTNNAALNDFLYEMKQAGVLTVLAMIFDNEERANFKYNYKDCRIDTSGTDYSQVIINRANLFDEVIGYQVACDVLQLCLTTSRSNLEERNAKLAPQLLKVELEGFTNEMGHIVAKGLTNKLNAAKIKTIEILFPQFDRNKPRITGRHPW